MKANSEQQHLGLGAEPLPNGARFRVWAPKCRTVEVVLENRNGLIAALDPEADGYFSGDVREAGPGTLYRYRLDGGDSFPDPCSRYQPEGPHGPSLIVDPRRYGWHDAHWPGVHMQGQVLYEIHVGAFTPEGTLDAAMGELESLKNLGVTLVELMPLAEFPGRWNWGYDGVDLFAPAHGYGDPDALKRFVDRAHSIGLGIILDVVYNHLGPDGNYLKAYTDSFFTTRHKNDWGEAINFDGPGSEGVRRFFIRNAAYWIGEFHLDGLRLDATQDIHDSSARHVLAEISQAARSAAEARSIVLIAENEPQDIRCLTPVEKGGFGLDAMWVDDFHHTARVALTGRREAYYTDYRGEPQEFISAIKRGLLYQGQRYTWQKKPRGTAVTEQPARSFVFYLQNHDQVANSLVTSERIIALAGLGRYRALAALLLLGPETPLLFMGQEFGASTPFPFFADHAGLADLIYQGRKKFLAQFPSYRSSEAQEKVPHPCLASTFERAKLKLSERETHRELYHFHRDLLQLRREDPVLAAQARDRIDGAVLGPEAFVLRFLGLDGDRLLVINLGPEFDYRPAPEPLLAPPTGRYWQDVWSSDAARYGGPGCVNPCHEDGWTLPGQSAVLLSAVQRDRDRQV